MLRILSIGIRCVLCRFTISVLLETLLAHEIGKDAQSLGAHVMLDPLGIDLRCCRIEAKSQEEPHNHLVAIAGGLGELPPGACQLDRLVRLGQSQTIPHQTPDVSADRDMAHAKVLGQIHDPAGALVRHDRSDRLDVILGHLGGMGLPDTFVSGCPGHARSALSG